MDFIPMSRPCLGPEEIEAVKAVLESGWITTGPKCQEFEQRFAALSAAGRAIALTSGTAGMHLLLKALGIGPGDEVITPSMTFASTVNQIALLGAKPVFVDVDYGTLLVKPEQIWAAITKQTKAIIPVHFAGAPCDLDEIKAACDGIPVIEDAAHAIGTCYKGRHIGGANYAVYSFHPIKNITTTEGGMLCGPDNGILKRANLLRFHGIERDAWKRYGKGSDPSYDITEPGYKYNMTDVQAALGLCQLERLEAINARRTEIAQLYLDGLKDVAGLDLPGVPAYEHVHSWHLFVVKVKSMARSEFMAALAEANIGYGLHFPACHKLSYVVRDFGAVELPETELAHERILSLPLYPGLTDDDVKRVIATIRSILA